jgi:hypothetical protein
VLYRRNVIVFLKEGRKARISPNLTLGFVFVQVSAVPVTTGNLFYGGNCYFLPNNIRISPEAHL